MPKRMLVHDRRLEGNPPSIAQNIYPVDESVATTQIIRWIGQYARSQSGLDELIIMCHGYAVLSDEVTLTTYAEPVGASGLQLGRHGLTLRNASETSAWRGSIRTIYLYACGASASSAHGNPEFDGRRFCGELALHSGAMVYAADRLQWYERGRTRWQSLWGTNQAGTIDFGRWEGQVFRYSPVDGRGTPATLAPQPT